MSPARKTNQSTLIVRPDVFDLKKKRSNKSAYCAVDKNGKNVGDKCRSHRPQKRHRKNERSVEDHALLQTSVNTLHGIIQQGRVRLRSQNNIEKLLERSVEQQAQYQEAINYLAKTAEVCAALLLVTQSNSSAQLECYGRWWNEDATPILSQIFLIDDITAKHQSISRRW